MPRCVGLPECRPGVANAPRPFRVLRGVHPSSEVLRATAQHAALPEGRSPGRRPLGRFCRLAEVSQDALDGLRLGDYGEQLHPPFARRALEHVDAERSLEELCPRPVAAATTLRGRRRRRVQVVGGCRGRGGLRDDARSELARRGEHACIANGVQPRRGHRSGEAREQGERVEVYGHRAVREGALESDAHEAVGAASDALLSHGRAQDVLAERLAPDGVERSSAGRGVQGKAVEAGTERLVEPERCVHEGG
jgi:hypothetical protein